MRLELARHARAVAVSGEVFALASRDAALLAWLAIEGPTPRGRLAALVWPDSAGDAARNSLRQRLFKLRKQLGAEVVAGNTTLALAAGVEHDLEDGDAVLADLDSLDGAIGGEFAQWLAQQRQRRHGRLRQSLADRADMAERAHDWPDAIGHAQELLALEPLSEDAHRRVIRLHYLAGDRAAALLAFDRCEQLLKDEVGAAPSAETLALLQTVEQAATLPVPSPQRVPASVLRPPRLVGRDAELRAADEAWAAGQVVALVGEAGMGKSRLLEQLLPPADASAVAVAARPGDAGVPLATVARLLRTLADRQPQALEPSTRRELARVLPEWAGDQAPAPEGQRLVFQRAVVGLLARQPGLSTVAIDDLHFADSASLNLLQALLDDESLPLRWAIAYRPAEAGSGVQALQAALLEHARLQPLRLQPLDVAALAALVDSLALPGVDGATLAPGLLRRTGGNPLFVLETLKQAWVEQSLARLADAQALPRPPSVARLVEARLGQLSEGALMVARCAAIAGQDFSTRLATRVLGQPALALASAWAELEAAQILRDEAFVHDLIFEATLASVPRVIARHLHGEIAEVLQAEGRAPPATLARHWLAAGQPAQALPQLERAAQAAARALDPAEAGRLWAQLAALRHEVGDADGAFDAALQAVLARRSADGGAELAAAIDRLETLARTPAQQATVHETRAAMFHSRGDAAQAAASVARGLQVLGPDAPPAIRVNLLNMHGVVLRHAGRLDDARAALDEALALTRSGNDLPNADLPAVLNNLGLVLQEQDDHLGAIALMQESAERQTDPLVRARVLNNLAISLEERGQVMLAREQRLGAARLVHGAGTLAELNLAISLGGTARYLSRYREAQTHLDHARELATGQRHWREENLYRVYGALWMDLGRLNLAREALDHALAVASRLDSAAVLMAQARLAMLQQQDPWPLIDAAEKALGKSGEARWLRRLWVLKTAALPPDDALALAQRELQTPALRDNAGAALPLQVRAAQALLALGRPDAALRHAQRAADWLQAVCPLGLPPTEVWLTLAQAAQAAGESDSAAAAAATGSQLVHEIAAEHVDELYRDGFRERNPVNAELIALAAALRR